MPDKHCEIQIAPPIEKMNPLKSKCNVILTLHYWINITKVIRSGIPQQQTTAETMKTSCNSTQII